MAITEAPTVSTTAASGAPSGRVIRSAAAEELADHNFAPVSSLPKIEVGRPGPTGNLALDALRAAAWDQGFADGRSNGIDDGYAAGYQTGRAEGHQAGYRDGQSTAAADAVAAIESRLGSALAALDQAAADLAAHDRMVLAQMEQAVVDLALVVAEAVLEREIATAADPGREALQRALTLAPDHQTYLARLNPADIEAMGEYSDLAPGRVVELAADPLVNRGGCVVEAGAARVDARIETALDRVREVLQP